MEIIKGAKRTGIRWEVEDMFRQMEVGDCFDMLVSGKNRLSVRSQIWQSLKLSGLSIGISIKYLKDSDTLRVWRKN